MPVKSYHSTLLIVSAKHGQSPIDPGKTNKPGHTTSKKKNAEHGGLSFGDTDVGLIVSNPRLAERTIKTPVATSQVAPTILEALGLRAEALGAVRIERTQVLPVLEEADE